MTKIRHIIGNGKNPCFRTLIPKHSKAQLNAINYLFIDYNYGNYGKTKNSSDEPQIYLVRIEQYPRVFVIKSFIQNQL